MQSFSASPNEIAIVFYKNLHLIGSLIKREVLGRYQGSVMGIFWAVFNPILMLIIYTFVFSVVFKTRWNPVGNESKVEFSLILFSGLLVFNLFSECLNRSPSLILSNANYVKKVIFPLEILPIVSLGSALFHFFISLMVWLLVFIIFIGAPKPTFLLLPLIILPMILFILGLTWALASLGVYLRDTAQFVGMFTTMVMFLSPIFYPAAALPEAYRKWLQLNPLSTVLEQVRDVLYWGNLPSLWEWLASLGVGLTIAMLGFYWFQKTRKGFADVL